MPAIGAEIVGETGFHGVDKRGCLRLHGIRGVVEPVDGAQQGGSRGEDELGEWQDDWLKKAKSMDPASLRLGLDYMAKNRIDSPVKTDGDIRVLFGRLDKAILPAMTLALKDFLPQAEFKERPKAGHWPPMLLF